MSGLETYRVRTDGAVIQLHAGATMIASVAAVPGVVRLLYDGSRVKVLNDGVELIAYAAAAGQRLFPKISLFNVGVTVKDIQSGPAGLQPDINSNIIDSFGGGFQTLPRNEIKTPLGTAAAIAGQAPTATNSDYTAVTGTKPPPGATVGADIHVNVVDSFGGSPALLTRAELRTSLGTAASIAGQASWATYTGLVPANVANQVQNLSTGGFLASLLNITGRRLTYLKRADDSTDVTEAAVVTGLGIAASVAGQGALATKGSVTFGTADVSGFGALAGRAKVVLGDGFTFRADGTTSLTDALAVTSLGIAASIAGQGALATKANVTFGTSDVSGFGALAGKASVAYGTSDVTGFGALAARAKISLGDGFTFRADGTTALTDALAVTSLGIAASIAGQGTLATKGSVNLDSEVVDGSTFQRLPTVMKTKVDGIETGADVTSLIAPGQLIINLSATSDGTIKSDNFPKTISATLSRNGAPVTSGITWSWAALLGTINGVASPSAYQANASTGDFALNLTAFAGAEGKIRLRAVYQGTTRTLDIPFSITRDAVATGTSGGGGGTAATVSSIASFLATTNASNTYGTSDNPMPNVRTGANGTITFSGNLSYEMGGATVGYVNMYGVYQYRPIGGSYLDAAAEAVPFSTAYKESDLDPDGKPYTNSESGLLNTAMTKTGLLPNTDYQIQLRLRDDTTNLHARLIGGNATATGS